MSDMPIKAGTVVVTSKGRVGTVKREAVHPRYAEDQSWSLFQVEFDTLFGSRTRWLSYSDIRLIVEAFAVGTVGSKL